MKKIIQVKDGTEMEVFIARPDSKENARRAPGIMVLQEAFGVNSHIQDVARRFAREGFVAIAPELFHRTAPKGFTAGYEEFESVKQHLFRVTQDHLEADAHASFEFLQRDEQVDPENIFCIGYCLGGRAAFIANSILPLRAAVSYYGGGIAPTFLELAKKQHAPILFFWGGLDAHIPPEQHQAVCASLRAAEKPFVNTEISDANHGFFCDERKSYQAKAAQYAWGATLSFIQQNRTGARQ